MNHNRNSIFHDGTEQFCRYNKQTDKYSFILRVGHRMANEVYIIIDNERIQMTSCYQDKIFEYYTVRIHLENRCYRYRFEIDGNEILFYNMAGADTSYSDVYDFSITPGFNTPDWAKGAVMYQIYVERFCNGDKTNDVETNEYAYIGKGVEKIEDWYENPAADGTRQFYGGDLQGVIDKMDYLEKLGVKVIYFNPLFVSPSNHKYDTQDYDYIDPHFGKIVVDDGDVLKDGETDNSKATKYISRVTNKKNLEASNELFIELVEEAHKRGIKVIIDGVFNHCGSFNKWLDRECIYEDAPGYEKGAFVSQDSPYRSYFKFWEEIWPYNTYYDGWWGHDTLPKLNYEESDELFQYVMHIARKWVSPPYNVDGWRLDVAADLGHSAEYNHFFWREFRRNVKEANPNAIILAEHYGDPKDWLSGDQWDTVMNYDAFMEPITWFLTGVEKHSDEFRGDMKGNADAFFNSMRHFMTRFNTQSLQIAMNELSNHDHSRFLTRTNSQVGRTNTRGPEAANQGIDKAVFRQAVMIQMTWPGAPTLYYGDEAGLCGWTDPDNRRAYPWGNEDKDLIEYHKVLISLHKECQALKTGSIMFLHGGYIFPRMVFS